MLTVNRSGRPGLISLAARTTITDAAPPTRGEKAVRAESSAGRDQIAGDALRTAAQAEAAEPRLCAAGSVEGSREAESPALLRASGDPTNSEGDRAEPRLNDGSVSLL
ncbi:hypothetical protein [Microbacterium sp. G2-8]|uniref:hypothetical protein n=1 Tax=Microbacterium sp. G2-8 TaxID=2842454 RepID=UPI001C8AEE97|nr:hypothetical protein [Microbacterium sp. G2-8]